MKTKFFSMMILLVCIAFAASAQEKDQKSGGDKVYYMVDEMPQFPGGEEALRTFVARGLNYPPEAMKGKIQGKVIITFVIDKTGKVTDAKVIRSAHPLLDAEALRVISSLPDWTPGKQKGEIVNVAYTMPVAFALQ